MVTSPAKRLLKSSRERRACGPSAGHIQTLRSALSSAICGRRARRDSPVLLRDHRKSVDTARCGTPYGTRYMPCSRPGIGPIHHGYCRPVCRITSFAGNRPFGIPSPPGAWVSSDPPFTNQDIRRHRMLTAITGRLANRCQEQAKIEAGPQLPGRIISTESANEQTPKIFSAWTAPFPAGASADLLTLVVVSEDLCISSLRWHSSIARRIQSSAGGANSRSAIGDPSPLLQRYHRRVSAIAAAGPGPRQRNTHALAKPGRLSASNNSRPVWISYPKAARTAGTPGTSTESSAILTRVPAPQHGTIRRNTWREFFPRGIAT